MDGSRLPDALRSAFRRGIEMGRPQTPSALKIAAFVHRPGLVVARESVLVDSHPGDTCVGGQSAREVALRLAALESRVCSQDAAIARLEADTALHAALIARLLALCASLRARLGALERNDARLRSVLRVVALNLALLRVSSAKRDRNGAARLRRVLVGATVLAAVHAALGAAGAYAVVGAAASGVHALAPHTFRSVVSQRHARAITRGALLLAVYRGATVFLDLSLF